MLVNENSIALLFTAFAATAPFVSGSGEQLQCEEPEGPPYDQEHAHAVPDDAAWEYEFIWCFGAEDACNEDHFYYTRATLTEGGFYLRRCTECE